MGIRRMNAGLTSKFGVSITQMRINPLLNTMVLLFPPPSLMILSITFSRRGMLPMTWINIFLESNVVGSKRFFHTLVSQDAMDTFKYFVSTFQRLWLERLSKISPPEK